MITTEPLTVTHPSIAIVTPTTGDTDVLMLGFPAGLPTTEIFTHLATLPVPYLGVVVNDTYTTVWAGGRTWTAADNNVSRRIPVYVDRDTAARKTSVVTFDRATAARLAKRAVGSVDTWLLVDTRTHTVEVA